MAFRTLWERYSRECDEFLDDAPEMRADAERSAELRRLSLAVSVTLGRSRHARLPLAK